MTTHFRRKTLKMAAANSKQRKSFSPFQKRHIKTSLILSIVICFIPTVGYACIRYGEIVKVCEEQDFSKSTSLMPVQFMKLLHKFLYWCGVQQTKPDLNEETSVLCSTTWIYIIYIIFTEKFPEDIGNFWCFMKDAFMNEFDVVLLYVKRFIEIITTSLPLPNYASCVIITPIILIAAILLRLWWRKNSSSDSYINDHLFDDYDDFIPSSKSCKSLQHTPMTPTCNYGWQKNIALNKGLSQQRYFGFSSFMHWMFFLITIAFILSIPWEFLRLYQKAVASHATSVMKGLPPHCTQTSLSWLENIQFLLRWHFSWSHNHDVCQDYYYASLVDPLWEVNPLLVLSSVFTQGMLHPFEVASSSLGRSVRAFFSEIPIQWQPFIMLFAAVMGAVLLLMTCRYRLSIPLFLKIEPKTPVTTPSERQNSRKDRSLQYDVSADNRNLSLRWDNDYQVQMHDKFSDNDNFSGGDNILLQNVHQRIPSSKKIASSTSLSVSDVRNQKNSISELSSQGKKNLDQQFAGIGINSRSSLISSRESKNYVKLDKKDLNSVSSSKSETNKSNRQSRKNRKT